MDPALRELVAAGDADEWIEAILRVEPEAEAEVPHIRTMARFTDIRTVRLKRKHIEAVWSHPATASLKAARVLQFEDPIHRQYRPDNPGQERVYSSPLPRIGRSGKGVVVGVVDWGFDFGSEAFKQRSGTSRILALWDQRGGRHELSPRFGYGRVLDQENLNAALQTDRPYEAVEYHPGDADTGIGAHGTHVADLAAGTRRDSLGGLASEADLVFVHLASHPLSGLANLGDSVRLLEAIQFIAETAGDRPFVINLSVGRHAGPHTGLSPVEQAFDRFLEQAPGRLIVQSAGNYFKSRTHTHGRVAPGQTVDLQWQINPGDRSPNETELWFSDRDRFIITVYPPGSSEGFTVRLGESRGLYLGNGAEIGRLYHRAFDPNTPDHHFVAYLNTSAPSGRWRLQIEGELVEDGRFHAWIERDGSGRRQSRFIPSQVTHESTIGSICNGFLPISVGAASDTAFGLVPAPFASAGPTRDGRQKPEVSAQGMRVTGARSTPRWSARPKQGVTRMSGASQASPRVAGLAAALMSGQDEPTDIHATRRLVMSAMRPLSNAEARDIDRLGSGFADPAYAADLSRHLDA
ncbi:MAG: S8 family serine peptidase [Pseudomonadota bacterium]